MGSLVAPGRAVGVARPVTPVTRELRGATGLANAGVVSATPAVAQTVATRFPTVASRRGPATPVEAAETETTRARTAAGGLRAEVIAGSARHIVATRALTGVASCAAAARASSTRPA